mgnify:CR=1 FL=1
MHDFWQVSGYLHNLCSDAQMQKCMSNLQVKIKLRNILTNYNSCSWFKSTACVQTDPLALETPPSVIW